MANHTRSRRRWSYVAGERGRNRVRVFDRGNRGIYLDFFEQSADGRRRRVRMPLGHSDRAKAKGAADELAAKFATATPTHCERLTLHRCLTTYLEEVTPTKGAGKQHHDRTSAALFCTAFGADRDPLTIGLREWNRFIAERRSGRLKPGGGSKGRDHTVRDRQIEYDLRFLLAVFNWATLAGDGKGGALLARNPCKGFPVPKEMSPRRPRMTRDRYVAMLAHAPSVHEDFAFALELVYETGHRLSSVRQLWWTDVALDRAMVRWRAETDKEGREHWTPLSDQAVTVLRAARQRGKALGETWIFPSAGRVWGGKSQAGQPRSRETFDQWWRDCEALAGLEHVPRMGWHSLRRAFATELKSLPRRDLMDLGGWKSSAVIDECYIEPDEATMRAGLSNRSRATTGTNNWHQESELATEASK